MQESMGFFFIREHCSIICKTTPFVIVTDTVHVISLFGKEYIHGYIFYCLQHYPVYCLLFQLEMQLDQITSNILGLVK